jgi:hypothetical protein
MKDKERNKHLSIRHFIYTLIEKKKISNLFYSLNFMFKILYCANKTIIAVTWSTTLARMARENTLLSASFAPASHTCLLFAYAFPSNLDMNKHH